MANQKVYNIVINGIKESISEVDVLLNQLDNLEKRLKNLGKEGIKLDTKGLKDLEKIKIPEISIEGIDAKALKKEMQQLEKDIAKGAKTIDGEYTNTLNGLRAKLRDLKTELGTVDIDVEADVFADLTDEIKELNDQVKQMEQDYGTFARNVGNYTESVVDALNEFDSQMFETAGTIEEVKEGVDSLKGKQLFDVNIGGVAVQFENVSQAIGEIDDMAHSAAAKMQELRNAGKENTEEYKKLNQEFQEFIQTSANLERVRKQTDELRDSVASTSRGLDMGVQAFQALGNAMQMASGIAGLFGDNQEKIEEAINRTVQIQAILQAAQELYNQTTQKGTVLNTLYSATFGKISGGLTNMTTKLGLGTKAAKLFNNTLKANIFIAIATAILWVVTNLDKLSEMLGLTNEDTKVFTDLWNKISPVLMGVGRAITDFLINPLRTLTKTISKVLQGDWKGAFEEIGKGVKEQFDVIKDYQKGYNDEVKRQSDNAVKQNKINLEKQLLHEKEFNEAKYGSDWKYTKDGIELYRKYFAAKLALYDKDSEEYRQALLEQISFERELKEHQEKGKNGGKSGSGSSSSKEDNRIEVQREIEDKILSIMKDGNIKRMAELKKQRERELKDAEIRKKQGELTEKQYQDLTAAIKEEYRNKELDEMNQHYVEVNNLKTDLERNLEANKSNVQVSMFDAILQKNYRDIDKFKEQIGTFFKVYEEGYEQNVKDVRKAVFGTDSSSLFDASKKTNILTRNTTQKALKELYDYYVEEYKLTETEKTKLYDFLSRYSGAEIGLVIETLNNRLKIEKEYFEREKSEEDSRYKELLNQAMNAEQKELDNVKLTEKEKLNIKKKYDVLYSQIHDDHYKMMDNINLKHKTNELILEDEANRERSGIISKYHDTVHNEFRKHYEQLEELRENYTNIEDVDLGSSELTTVGSFASAIAQMTKFKKEYKNTLNDIQKQKDELRKQRQDGVISEEEFNNTFAQLDLLETEVKQSLKEISLNWKEWSVGLAQVTNAVVGMWAQMYSQIADLQYQNEMYRIEKLQEEYDKETEILQDALDEQEELFEKHNQNVNDIEGELETARGDRRLFLLDQINAEMMKREQAWAQQQKIQKQQEQLEKKKEALEQRQKAAEQKRNKQNQKVQIAQATASTALAVTNALAVQPWFLGVALAAVAAAMGAVQIATIAKQKFADGGVIQGKSHSQGGVPVLGGSAEVEGGEYITNKVTTSKNVEVLTFINSKKKKLDLSDFAEFYSNGSNKNYSKPFKTVFADGGTLPSMNAPMIDTRAINSIKSEDNRPIYVSVTEIENVQNKVRNVRAIAGLED